MKNGMIILGLLSLSIVFSSVGYADDVRPEKSVIMKTVTITTVQSPIRGTIRNLRNRLEDRPLLRSIRSKLRSLLCFQCVQDIVITDVEVLPPVEQETEK